MITSIRKPISSTMLAIAAIVVLSVFTAAVAQADSGHAKAKFDAEGTVLGVGGASAVDAEFIFGKKGLKKIKIHTEGEGVLGFIDTPISCKDKGKKNAGACAALSPLVDGNFFSSLHTSDVTLKVDGPPTTQFVFGIPVFETVSGKLKGRLEGLFFAQSSTSSFPHLLGSSDLKIKGTATYACFTVFGPGVLVPGDIADCSGVDPAKLLLPVVLDVKDKGRFIIGESGIVEEIKGKLEVNAQVNVLPTIIREIEIAAGSPAPPIPPFFGGDIKISKAKAKLHLP